MLFLQIIDLWTFNYPGFTTIKSQHFTFALSVEMDLVSKKLNHAQLRFVAAIRNILCVTYFVTSLTAPGPQSGDMHHARSMKSVRFRDRGHFEEERVGILFPLLKS